ncbi:hypothetical protein AB0892_15160 [Streptomyces sp. NPDC005409]
MSAGDGGLFEDSVLAKLRGGDREAAQQRLHPPVVTGARMYAVYTLMNT